MLKQIPYNRQAAVAYAHKWAFGRNPAYYDYEEIGGDSAGTTSMPIRSLHPGQVWSTFMIF